MTACAPCNRAKGDRTPNEAKMPLLAEPTKPSVIAMGRTGLFRGDLPSEWELYLPDMPALAG